MSKDSEAVDVIAKLNGLLDELRGNVAQLNAILTTPEVPNGDPTAA